MLDCSGFVRVFGLVVTYILVMRKLRFALKEFGEYGINAEKQALCQQQCYIVLSLLLHSFSLILCYFIVYSQKSDYDPDFKCYESELLWQMIHWPFTFIYRIIPVSVIMLGQKKHYKCGLASIQSSVQYHDTIETETQKPDLMLFSCSQTTESVIYKANTPMLGTIHGTVRSSSSFGDITKNQSHY